MWQEIKDDIIDQRNNHQEDMAICAYMNLITEPQNTCEKTDELEREK